MARHFKREWVYRYSDPLTAKAFSAVEGDAMQYPETPHEDDGTTVFDYARVQFTGCPMCGRDTSNVPPADLAAAIADAARRWAGWLQTVTDHPGGIEELCLRPEPETWSAIEYACHVRDVLALFTRRSIQTVIEDVPEYGWWDHEQEAELGNYVQQDPVSVGRDLIRNAEEYAEALLVLQGDAWLRRGTRRGTEFTVVGLARFALHEAIHHLQDAQDGVHPEAP